MVLKVCEAMAFAHSKGVIHRDLKPANIMVGRFGETYVMDWGLARVLGRREAPTTCGSSDGRLGPQPGAHRAPARTSADDPQSPLVTMDGDVIGTPSYMALEQAEGRLDEVGPRSDVYALGAILYHLLTGRAPYVKPGAKMSPHTVLSRALEGPPTPIHRLNREVPSELVAICEKAMARDPEARYPSMLELAADIEAFLDGRVVGAYEGGSVAEARKWIQRNRGMAASIGVAILLAVGGLAGVMSVQRTKTSELEQANIDLTDAKNLAEEKERDARDALEAKERAAAEAMEARNQANENAAQALDNERIARQRSYMSNIRAAEYSLRLHEVVEARSLLDRCDEDLRDWEWQHLKLRLEGQHGSPVNLTTRIGAVRVSADGNRLLSLTGAGRLYLHDLGSGQIESGAGRNKSLWMLKLSTYVDLDLSPDEETAALVGHRSDRVVLLDASGLQGPVQDLRELFQPHEIDEGDGGMLPPDGLVVPGLTPDAMVITARFGPEDDLLAVGYSNGVLLIWDHAARELVHVLEGHGSAVNSVAWTPDGRFLASASSDGSVRVWLAATGEALHKLDGHEGPVYAVAVSRDGALLASGAHDRRVRVWNTQTGRFVGRHDEHSGAVRSLAFQPRGTLLVSGGDDATLQVVDAAKLQPSGSPKVRALLGHEGPIRSLSFNAAGTLLVSGAEDGSLRAWDPEVGGSSTDLIEAYRGPRAPTRLSHITAADYHPGSVLCLTGHSDGSISIWNTWTGELDRSLRGGGGLVSFATWSDDGSSILSASVDGNATLWDADTGAVRRVFEGHTSWIRAAAFGPDQRWIVTASGDRTARVWDVATGEQIHSLEGHGGWVNAVAVSRDGEHIWTGSYDNMLRLWRRADGQLLNELEMHAEIRRLAISDDGTLLAVGSGDGGLAVVDTVAGIPLFTRDEGTAADFGDDAGEPVTALDFNPSGTRLAMGAFDGLVRVFDARSGDHLLTLRGHSGAISGVSFDAEGQRLLTVSDAAADPLRSSAGIAEQDEVALIWETGAKLQRRDQRRHAARLRREARPLVEGAFSTKFRVRQVLDFLDRAPLTHEVRQAAKRMARVRGDDGMLLAEESWVQVRAPGHQDVVYELAHRRAEAAAGLEPEDRFCLIVLGAAQYRRGFVAAAVQSLTTASSLSGGDTRSNVALHSFLAMAHRSLGHSAEAREHLGRLQTWTGLLLLSRETDALEALVEEAKLVAAPGPGTPTGG